MRTELPNPGSLEAFEKEHVELDRPKALGEWERSLTDYRISLVRTGAIDIGRLGVSERAIMIEQDLSQQQAAAL